MVRIHFIKYIIIHKINNFIFTNVLFLIGFGNQEWTFVDTSEIDRNNALDGCDQDTKTIISKESDIDFTELSHLIFNFMNAPNQNQIDNGDAKDQKNI